MNPAELRISGSQGNLWVVVEWARVKTQQKNQIKKLI
jgi:hypothetical protein